MILLDTSSTTDSASLSGIQRVVRNIYVALKRTTPIHPLCYDRLSSYWRNLYPHEYNRLTLSSKATLRETTEFLKDSKNLINFLLEKTHLRKQHPFSISEKAHALITGDIFHHKTFQAYPQLNQYIAGPKVAVVHDLVALHYPQFATKNTVSYFPHYLQHLTKFDGIAAISEESRHDLLAYWKFLNIKNPPPVVTLPLGTNLIPQKKHTFSHTNPLPLLLCVCTIEGRKNHLNLLLAAKNLWDKGIQFRLCLVGNPIPSTAAPALTLAKQLITRKYPLELLGKINDHQLQQLYAQCHFTIYPSYFEGFGLPILESLSHSKPCICGNGGALKSTAQGGGCLQLHSVEAEHLEKGISELLQNNSLYQELCKEASSRTFRTWTQYTSDLLEFTQSLQK